MKDVCGGQCPATPGFGLDYVNGFLDVIREIPGIDEAMGRGCNATELAALTSGTVQPGYAPYTMGGQTVRPIYVFHYGEVDLIKALKSPESVDDAFRHNPAYDPSDPLSSAYLYKIVQEAGWYQKRSADDVTQRQDDADAARTHELGRGLGERRTQHSAPPRRAVHPHG